MDAESLVEALNDAEEGVPPFAPGLAAKLLAEFARTGAAVTAAAGPPAPSPGTPVQPSAPGPPPPPAEADEALTPRQLEVLSLVAQGLAYRQVGARLSLSPRTVKYHMAEIMRKLHLQNRAQLLAQAAGITTRADIV